MKKLLLASTISALIFFPTLASIAVADIEYTYTAPVERSDTPPTPLDISEIQGYRLKYSVAGGEYNYIDTVGGNTLSVIAPGGEGVWIAQIATVEIDGRISKYSDPISTTVGPIDSIPLALPNAASFTTTTVTTWVCNSDPCVLEIK